MPTLLIVLPFLFIILLNLPFKSIMRKAAFPLAVSLSFFQVLIVSIRLITKREFISGPFAGFFDSWLAVDNLTLVALLSIGIVLSAALWVGRAMFSNEGQRFNFINLLLLALLGMNITVTAADLFLVYVFIEVTAISSFILIAMTKDKLAVEGAFKYLILSSVATVLILFSIGLFLLFSGSTSFAAISSAFHNSGNAFLLKLAVVLFLCGLFIKSGIVPFHGWLPDAYSASYAPISVLLAGIVTKVSGVYVLLRLMTSVFTGFAAAQKVLMLLGLGSIIIGALLSLTQNNFKRLLSYSSISQVGYIILAAGCATPLALLGATLHFFNHAVFKSLLFVNAAAVEKQTGSIEMDKLGGLAEKMPVTGVTSVIAMLSTAGIPPLSGFWSKLIIVVALWGAGYYFYAGIALLASVITLGYLLYFQRQVFFGKLKAGLENVREAEFSLLLPQIALAAIIIIVGIGLPLMLRWR
jgi:multicomponent Na+:H+ antiporter subunit D